MTLQEYLKAAPGRREWLANELGVSRVTLWRWAKNKKVPSKMERAAIALATGGEVVFSIVSDAGQPPPDASETGRDDDSLSSRPIYFWGPPCAHK